MIGKRQIEQTFGEEFSDRFNIHRTRRAFPVADGIDDFRSMALKGVAVVDRAVADEMGGEVDLRNDRWRNPAANER